uniref:Uncharacterized protein LOC111131624 n=1 Tax=Crassostrea virginica TaxID=6565 RepID=A0A8B8E6B5_CRAVI|nr:uncharacterized protein LOC111131624 [Crassostrea virginica]
MIWFSLLLMSFPSVLGGVQNFDRGSPGKVEVPSPNNGRGSTATAPVSPNTRLINRAASSGNMEVPSRNGPLPGLSQRPRIMFPPRVPFICTLFADSGYFCPSGYSRPSTQYFYDPFTQTCETFYYRGCGGTLNRFSSRRECLRGCGCYSDIDPGNSCPNVFPASTIRYAFNQYSGTCQSFRFSECHGGNDNNFRSQLECQTTCGPIGNSNGQIFPFNGMSPVASNINFSPQNLAPTVNTRSLNDASSQMATQELAPNPSNSGSLTNFGSSSLMAIESPSENFNSRVMGFPAFQTNFGSSAITAGNSPQNRRQRLLPSPLNSGAGSASLLNPGMGSASPLNLGVGPIFVSREQITMRSGSGSMQSRMLPRTGNKIYA